MGGPQDRWKASGRKQRLEAMDGRKWPRRGRKGLCPPGRPVREWVVVIEASRNNRPWREVRVLEGWHRAVRSAEGLQETLDDHGIGDRLEPIFGRVRRVGGCHIQAPSIRLHLTGRLTTPGAAVHRRRAVGRVCPKPSRTGPRPLPCPSASPTSLRRTMEAHPMAAAARRGSVAHRWWAGCRQAGNGRHRPRPS
jgi:hypothetical protein